MVINCKHDSKERENRFSLLGVCSDTTGARIWRSRGIPHSEDTEEVRWMLISVLSHVGTR
jgi:hypothetical protein